VAIAALTAWSAENDAPANEQAAAINREQSAAFVDDILDPKTLDDNVEDAPPAPRKRTVSPTASPTSSPTAKPMPRPAVKPVAARPDIAESAPVLAPPRRRSTLASSRPAQASVTQANFEPEIAPVPDSGPGLIARPFRKIANIVPYDNYEPDAELAGKDHCYNLCPRPQGGDCPDCTKDGDGNTIPCPECPFEQELRRIGRAPGEPDRPFVPRDFAHMHYCWEPTNLYHNPIYFEDVPLERYGHTRNYLVIQPAFSIFKFGIQLIGLPYQMSLYPVWDKQYSLGYYRPGEYVPYKYYQIPLNAKAAIVEAGVISGGYFIFAPGVGP
jgi:hypothetical protein